MPASQAKSAALTSYHRWLFFFLGVAGFFDGYDTFALSQILHSLRDPQGRELSHQDSGVLVAFINIGVILAYALVRYADRWGRRRVLTVTILGYTACTALTALSPNIYYFAVFQLAARVFLTAEWAVSTVYAAEEFPAERRGTMIGLIHGANAMGAVLCAGIAPTLCKTAYGWRSVYLAGVLPLLLLAIARRSLRETKRWSEQVKGSRQASFTRILAPAWRGRMLLLAVIWGLTYACTACGVTFYKKFAVIERGISDDTIGANVAMSALLAVPLSFGTGKLIDRIGRRGGAIVIYMCIVLGTLGAYNVGVRALVVASLIAAVVGITGCGVLLAAYNAELFPTDLRGDAFGWSNNLLGRIPILVVPPLVGTIAERSGWSLAVSLTAICPAIAVVLIIALLPETSGRELEETSRPPAKMDES